MEWFGRFRTEMIVLMLTILVIVTVISMWGENNAMNIIDGGMVKLFLALLVFYVAPFLWQLATRIIEHHTFACALRYAALCLIDD